jgi:diamine N-acetyltransferase
MFTRSSQRDRQRRALVDRALATGRLTTIREFQRADVDRWLAWPRHRDPLFESYNPPTLTLRQRNQYFQQYRDARDCRQFAVCDLEGEMVGRISLREIDWTLGVSVLGISFHPERLGQGLGTDGLWSFLGHYFGPLRMTALFLDVAAYNSRAQRVYEKCGFYRVGQRWGEAQTDLAGVFRKHEYAAIRHLFLWDSGLIRPLLYDMVLRRPEWTRLWEERRC